MKKILFATALLLFSLAGDAQAQQRIRLGGTNPQVRGLLGSSNAGLGADLSGAAAGLYPRADGAGIFLASIIAAAGSGPCINEFWRSGNDNAAPTCAPVNLTLDVTATLPVGSGGTGTPTAFTLGSVVFAGASGVYTEDNANLFWHNINNRLGIGTSAPDNPLSIVRTLNALADLAIEQNYHLKIQNTNDINGQGVGIALGMSSADDQQTAAIVARRTGSNGQGTLQFYTKQSTTTGVAPELVLTLDENGNANFGVATGLEVPNSAGAAPTTVAFIAYDTTQDTFKLGGRGSISGGVIRVLKVSFSTSDTLVASTIGTTETAFSTTFSIPANFFIANKVLRITVVYSFVASASPPNLVPRLRVQKSGPTNVYLWDGGSRSLSDDGSVGHIYFVQGTAAPGAAVAVEMGAVHGTGEGLFWPLNRNIQSQPATVDTASAQTLQITMQYSAGTAGNSITLRQMIVEELNP